MRICGVSLTISGITGHNWKHIFHLFEKWIPYAGSGHWPDGDMLPLGRIGIRAERGNDRMSMFTKDEQYTLMSLFLICRSPLMFGGNLPDNDKFTLNLITNEEALAVLQKSQNNKLLFDEGKKIAWTADDLNSNAKYVALFYTSGQEPIVESKALWRSRLITSRAGEQSADCRRHCRCEKTIPRCHRRGRWQQLGSC